MQSHRNSPDVLSRDECLRLLGRTRIGRVVVTDRALPAVFPVTFAVVDEDVVFATATGSRLESAAADAVVAFEADDIDPRSQSGWSVLVQGPANRIVDPDGFAAASTLLLSAWGPGKEVAFVRIRSELVSGRRLLPITVHRVSGTAARAVGSNTPGRASASFGPGSFAGCPSCGSSRFLPVSNGETRNFVCTACAACWHAEDGELRRVDPATCPRCSFWPMCSAAAVRDRFLRAADSGGR